MHQQVHLSGSGAHRAEGGHDRLCHWHNYAVTLQATVSTCLIVACCSCVTLLHAGRQASNGSAMMNRMVMSPG